MDQTTETKNTAINRKEFLKAAAVGGAGFLLVTLGEKNVLADQTKTPKWGMAVDLKRCIGCRACTVACKAENEVPLGVFRSFVHYRETGDYPDARRYFAATLCNHCDKPPCIEVCPVNPVEAVYKSGNGNDIAYEKKATYKRPDGAVLVDYDRCIGCHQCVANCPYGARFVDPFKQAGANPGNNTVGKCTLCVHRLDKGIVPSCVQTCVGRALIFGDLNDPSSPVSRAIQGKSDVWKPEAGTGPNVRYLALKDKAVLGEEVYPL